MAVTTYKATDLNNRVTMADGPYGNGAVHVGKVAPSSAPLTSDVLRVLRIPAGMRVDEVTIINDDCDSSSAAITCKVGYTPVNSSDGPTADDAYWFAASQTFLQGAARTTSKAKPITFDYDVWVDLTVIVPAGSYIAGAEVHAVVRGEMVGPK